jgi:hypothetical protein
VPDEVQRPVPRHLRASGGAADLLDQALEFRVAFGAYPRTWAEFISGTAHLGRAAPAEKLRIADAVAATRDPKGWDQWKRDHQTLAGL